MEVGRKYIRWTLRTDTHTPIDDSIPGHQFQLDWSTRGMILPLEDDTATGLNVLT